MSALWLNWSLPHWPISLALQLLWQAMVGEEIMATKIHDQFTDLPVSRQRKEQLRKQAKGICIYGACGEPIRKGNKNYCAKHSVTRRKYLRVVDAKMANIKVPVKFV